MTTFYIVRHGQTVWNTQNRWQGHQDSGLTARGQQQVHDLACRLKSIHFDFLYTSSLPRAVSSAHILAQHLRLTVRTEDLLKERKAGPIEGTTAAERAEQPHLQHPLHTYLQLSATDKWTHRPFPDWETNQEVAERLEAGLVRLGHLHPQHTLLVVAHGGNIRYFLNHIGSITPEQADNLRFPNAGMVVIGWDGRTFQVVNMDSLVDRTQE